MSRTHRPIPYYFAMTIPPAGPVVVLPGIINASIASLGVPLSPIENEKGEPADVVILGHHLSIEAPGGAAENHRAQGLVAAAGLQEHKLFGPHLVLFHRFINRDGSLSVPPAVLDCEGAGWEMMWVKDVDDLIHSPGWDAREVEV